MLGVRSLYLTGRRVGTNQPSGVESMLRCHNTSTMRQPTGSTAGFGSCVPILPSPSGARCGASYSVTSGHQQCGDRRVAKGLSICTSVHTELGAFHRNAISTECPRVERCRACRHRSRGRLQLRFVRRAYLDLKRQSDRKRNAPSSASAGVNFGAVNKNLYRGSAGIGLLGRRRREPAASEQWSLATLPAVLQQRSGMWIAARLRWQNLDTANCPTDLAEPGLTARRTGDGELLS
jgi:hypothetical protein